MQEADSALEAARAWVVAKGWTLEHYTVSRSHVQSCPAGAARLPPGQPRPAGCVSVDVSHSGAASDDELDDVEALPVMSREEVLMRSRMLEVRLPAGPVENVLAARDTDKLRVQMGGSRRPGQAERGGGAELEHVRMLTEELTYQSGQMEEENARAREQAEQADEADEPAAVVEPAALAALNEELDGVDKLGV